MGRDLSRRDVSERAEDRAVLGGADASSRGGCTAPCWPLRRVRSETARCASVAASTTARPVAASTTARCATLRPTASSILGAATDGAARTSTSSEHTAVRRRAATDVRDPASRRPADPGLVVGQRAGAVRAGRQCGQRSATPF